MVPVKNSVLASYFDDIQDVDLQEVGLLDASEAAKFWAENFNGRARGLYDLPDDSWVVQEPWSAIGNWMDAYNWLGISREIEDLIANESNWSTSETLLLVQNSQQIVTLPLGHFFKYWKELLAGFDDGPILMSSRRESTAVLRFVPLGQIMRTTKR